MIGIHRKFLICTYRIQVLPPKNFIPPFSSTLIHQQLKVDRAETTLAVVDDVLGPDFAFNVDKYTSC